MVAASFSDDRNFRIQIHPTEAFFRPLLFFLLIASLETGRIDMIASGMFITPERSRRVAFTTPTLRVFPALLLRTSSQWQSRDLPTSFHALVDSTDAVVAVILNAAEHAKLTTRGMPDSRIRAFPDVNAAYDALSRGDVSCIALSRFTLEKIMENPDKRPKGAPFVLHPLTGEPVDGDTTGFALRRSDSSLVSSLNRSLSSFIGSDEQLGLLTRFGFSGMNVPSAPRDGIGGMNR